MTFRFLRLHLEFRASGTIRFPKGTTANMLRGGLGAAFRRLSCVPHCIDSRTCPTRATCAYASLFEPADHSSGPSGLADWPRPFVLRVRTLDGQITAPGNSFSFALNLFRFDPWTVEWFVRSFAELGRAGFGHDRVVCELVAVRQLDLHGRAEDYVAPRPCILAIQPAAASVHDVGIRFLTPTEIKYKDQIVDRPEFGIVMRRIRDRLSALICCYSSGEIDIDFAQFGERADKVALTRFDATFVDLSRRSSRTGQVHSLGGFVGEAVYSGALAEFLPFLRAAQFTGLGRQTTWGKGEIEVVD